MFETPTFTTPHGFKLCFNPADPNYHWIGETIDGRKNRAKTYNSADIAGVLTRTMNRHLHSTYDFPKVFDNTGILTAFIIGRTLYTNLRANRDEKMLEFIYDCFGLETASAADIERAKRERMRLAKNEEQERRERIRREEELNKHRAIAEIRSRSAQTDGWKVFQIGQSVENFKELSSDEMTALLEQRRNLRHAFRFSEEHGVFAHHIGQALYVKDEYIADNYHNFNDLCKALKLTIYKDNILADYDYLYAIEHSK